MRLLFLISCVFFIQCKTATVDPIEILQTDFSFLKTMAGKTYTEIVAEKPILRDYLNTVVAPAYKDKVINILKNESQTLFLHEEIAPCLFTSDARVGIVESNGKLFVAYYDEASDKMHEYIPEGVEKPMAFLSFSEDWN